MTTVTFHQVSSPEGHPSFVKTVSIVTLGLIKSLVARIDNELAIRTAVRALRRMDDRSLADIGICRAEINAAVRGRRVAR
jgi:uncharacterized protein YjiS (DUF1127 family)